MDALLTNVGFKFHVIFLLLFWGFTPFFSCCHLSRRSSSVQRLRPTQPVLAVVVHRVDAAAAALLGPVLGGDAERDEGLVRRQQRARKGVAPVDAEARARDLHPALDVGHERQLAGEDFAEQQVDPGDAAVAQAALDERHGVRVALAAERAEDEPPAAGAARRLDGCRADRLHLAVAVRLARELARVRVVAVRGDGRVVDHDALEVEAAVAEVQDEVDAVLVAQARRRAAENLALAERRNLRDEHAEARGLEAAAHAVDGGVELDRADEGHGLAAGKVALQRGHQVRRVDAYVDKDVQRLDLGHVDGDEAAVGVVHEQIAAEGARRVVVDAAGAVRHVAHDERLDSRAKLRQDVGDGGGKEQQALGHLQRDLFRARRLDAVDRLGNLKVVVGGEQRNGFLELGVLGNLGRHAVQ